MYFLSEYTKTRSLDANKLTHAVKVVAALTRNTDYPLPEVASLRSSTSFFGDDPLATLN